MTKLEDLVKQYKRTKNKKILNEIFIILEPNIKKKTNYVYGKLKSYKLEKSDIRQELYIKIMQIIEEYKMKDPFDNYLYSCLKTWQPEMKVEDVMQYESLYNKNQETGEETEERFRDKSPEEIISNLTIEDIFNECKTENEKKICEMYLENPTITEEELGKKLKMTHQNISLILIELRKRLKYYLQK
jgi:DNA-directed RNA polymerase specialized sigma24 family protein